MKPEFSVVIPSYNHERYIGGAIESVINQTFKDWELIIIDDGSPDNSVEIIKQYKDPRIRLLTQENHDAPYTINRGMREAKGKYIAILNSDDLFEPNKLEECHNTFSEGYDFVFGKISVIDENNRKISDKDERVAWIDRHLNDSKEGPTLNKLLSNINYFITTSNFVFKKDIIEKVGYFHEKLHYGHDFDFLLRLYANKIKIKFIPFFVCQYRMHSDNTLAKGRSEVVIEVCYAISKMLKSAPGEEKIIPAVFFESPIYSNAFSFMNGLSHSELERIISGLPDKNRDRLMDIISYYSSQGAKGEKEELISEINPLVSVVIPCYNYGKFIEEAIDSVLASTYQNIEIIVVDDGPTDPFTIELLSKLNKPKTRVIFQENQGLAQARNTGISESKGGFILPLDADDKIDPTYIEKALYVLRKNPSRAFAYCYVQLFGAENYTWYTEEYDLNKLKIENIVPSCTLFRKEAWKKSGGYDKDRHQYDDWTFWLKLGMHGFYGKLIPEILFFHRKHGGQDNMTDRMKARHKEYYAKMKKRLPSLFRKSNVFYRLFANLKLRVLRRRKKNENNSFISLPTVCSDKSKKILIFLPWIIRGGVEKVILDIIKNLDVWEFFLITTQKGEYDSAVDLDFKAAAKNVYHLPNFLSEEDYISFVENLISSQVIQTVLFSHCFWAYRNLEKMKTKFRNVNFFDLLHNTMEGGFKDWSKKYGQWITETVVISDELKKYLTKKMGFPEKKVKCILNGIDVENVFNPANFNISEIENDFSFPKDKKGIAFVGRLSSEKDPLKFVKIAIEIDNAFPCEYFFVVVGGGELMDTVIAEADSHFDKKDFICLGNYSHPERVLALSHFLVNTSTIEGMPLTIIEALAMKVPVIAPSIGAIGEIIKDGYNGCLLGKNPTVADYVEAVGKSRSENIYRQLKLNARASVVDKYSSKRMAKEYEQVFTSC